MASRKIVDQYVVAKFHEDGRTIIVADPNANPLSDARRIADRLAAERPHTGYFPCLLVPVDGIHRVEPATILEVF
jgi:hypothetical protein